MTHHTCRAKRFLSREGEVMFAFAPDTDPQRVALEFVWAWAAEAPPGRQSVCGMPEGCPSHEGGYCIECHSTAFNASERYKKRFGGK